MLREEKPLRPAKILVVDDEPPLVKLVRSNLEAQHYKVISALDGPSGLAMVEKEGIDLVVLDIMLPGITMISDACHAAGTFHMFASDGDLWPVADDLFGASGVEMVLFIFTIYDFLLFNFHNP